ncbi:hypothetical protein SAMD00019534_094330 [Acytostelium subglobosum LB1]|uniref:hypothetical protein n=1 Tax=Acytostelium subglobosum LB1 TaxID=1410327 RepID=UPI0006450790|nr:hypothetical protein SAMD00019534_094330 [Acytostelium subglobosum LB1]GAM26258.1 hypothetical protein SAMD00019534_094330 [Acytostelium subglobosum LB1]|eukprot:XP_012750812.1 hypothetical protein SAMD00019534_094330 [Acytostelium subglobosum LB1]
MRLVVITLTLLVCIAHHPTHANIEEDVEADGPQPFFPNSYIFNDSISCQELPGCDFNNALNWLNSTAPTNNSNVLLRFKTSDPLQYIYCSEQTILSNIDIGGNVLFNYMTVTSTVFIRDYSNLTINDGYSSAYVTDYVLGQQSALSFDINSPLVIGTLVAGVKSLSYLRAPQITSSFVQSQGYVTIESPNAYFGEVNATHLQRLSVSHSTLTIGGDLLLTPGVDLMIETDLQRIPAKPPIFVDGHLTLDGWLYLMSTGNFDTNAQYYILGSNNAISGGFSTVEFSASATYYLNITSDGGRSPYYEVLSFPNQNNGLSPSIIALIVIFSLIFVAISIFLIYVLVKCYRDRRRSRYSYQPL